MAENTDRPIYFFRFEDVMANPRVELQNLMKFILGMDSIEGTVLEQRIEDVVSMGAASTQIYKPRSGGSNKNLMNYTPEQLEYKTSELEKLVHFFGYAVDEKNPNNITPYFDYKGTAKKESVNLINGFKRLNERAFLMREQQIKKFGKTPPREIISNMLHIRPGEIKMIPYFELMDSLHLVNQVSF